MNNELVGEIPAKSLVLGGGAPVYEREYKEPAYYRESKKFDIRQIEEPHDCVVVARQLMANHNIASKKWIYEQYDSMVGTVNMSTNKPSDAAIVSIKNSNKALALTVDCNARYVNADPEDRHDDRRGRSRAQYRVQRWRTFCDYQLPQLWKSLQSGSVLAIRWCHQRHECCM
jgi:phosphoribosylformylglycinamidine (FGAM) synthase-like enzyme